MSRMLGNQPQPNMQQQNGIMALPAPQQIAGAAAGSDPNTMNSGSGRGTMGLGPGRPANYSSGSGTGSGFESETTSGSLDGAAAHALTPGGIGLGMVGRLPTDDEDDDDIGGVAAALPGPSVAQQAQPPVPNATYNRRALILGSGYRPIGGDAQLVEQANAAQAQRDRAFAERVKAYTERVKQEEGCSSPNKRRRT